jgi:hypothetical protein
VLSFERPASAPVLFRPFSMPPVGIEGEDQAWTIHTGEGARVLGEKPRRSIRIM